MPPDDISGGRDRHVRDVTAPFFSTAFVNFPSTISPPFTPDSSPPTSHFINSPTSSTTQEVAIDILNSDSSVCSIYPLTPCASTEDILFESTKPTFDLLNAAFPEGLKDAEAQNDVSATLPGGLKGVLVDKKTDARSLYVLGFGTPAISNEDMKALLVELFDLAYEKLEADEVVFVLSKHQLGVRELVQGLMYVGGHVIRAPRDDGAEDSFVLVGIEL